MQAHSCGAVLNERNADLARQQIDAALKIAPRNTRVLMHQGSLKVLRKTSKGPRRFTAGLSRPMQPMAPAYVQLGLIYNLTTVSRRLSSPSTRPLHSILTRQMPWLSSWSLMFATRNTTRL